MWSICHGWATEHVESTIICCRYLSEMIYIFLYMCIFWFIGFIRACVNAWTFSNKKKQDENNHKKQLELYYWTLSIANTIHYWLNQYPLAVCACLHQGAIFGLWTMIHFVHSAVRASGGGSLIPFILNVGNWWQQCGRTHHRIQWICMSSILSAPVVTHWGQRHSLV